MDLKSLVYFVSAVEEGSITKAAKKNNISQPSIYFAIQKLEEKFDTLLIERTRLGLKPTESGSELYVRAKQLLHHASSITEYFCPNKATTAISIWADPSISYHYVEHVVDIFQSSGFRVNLYFPKLKEDADFFISPREEEREEFVKISSERYAVLLPSSHMISSKSTVNLEDLFKVGMIKINTDSYSKQCEKLRVIKGLYFNTVAEVDSHDKAISLVACGVGALLSSIPSNFSNRKIRPFLLEEITNSLMPSREIGIHISHGVDEIKKSLIEEIFYKKLKSF